MSSPGTTPGTTPGDTDPGDINLKLPSQVFAAGMGFLIFVILLVVGGIIGIIRLIMNWNAFGDRAIPMLLVTIFIPLGFLWPLFASKGPVMGARASNGRGMVGASRKRK